MSEELLPCPFCGETVKDVREGPRVWNGMKYGEPASVSVFHHCPRIEGQPTRSIERIGRDRASAIAAWNMRAPVAPPVELQDVAGVIAEGGGFWRSCSGCHETEDGHPVGDYPYSAILKCDLGAGCSECGGIGAVWDNLDYEAMGRALEADMEAEEAREVPKPANVTPAPVPGAVGFRYFVRPHVRSDGAQGEPAKFGPALQVDDNGDLS